MNDPSPLSLLADSVRQLRADMTQSFEGLNTKIDRVEAHTSATNGRVRALELWHARAEGARGAYGWLIPVGSSLLSGGAITAVLALTHHL